MAGAFVSIDATGGLIERGYVRPEDETPMTGQCVGQRRRRRRGAA